MSYEVEPIVIERFSERTVRVGGYASKFKVFETVYRVVVTRVLSELLSPDGSVLTSFYIDTRYIETEYAGDKITKFLGLTRIAELPQVVPPPRAPVEKPVLPLPIPVPGQPQQPQPRQPSERLPSERIEPPKGGLVKPLPVGEPPTPVKPPIERREPPIKLPVETPPPVKLPVETPIVIGGVRPLPIEEPPVKQPQERRIAVPA